MMEQEYKQPWVKALRSSKYEQGKGLLKRNNKYCCLGVLCEINKLEEKIRNDRIYFNYKDNFSCGFLPLNFREEAGITDEEEQQLIKMNDDAGKSFKEIADWIEVNL